MNDRLVDGWITLPEMKLVLDYMNFKQSDGNILEVGAASGRLFSFLYNYHPKWYYVAVDPWELDGARLQLDWNRGYFEPNNLGEPLTEQLFKNNCPYAITHKCYYEDYNTNEKYNIISLGLAGKQIDWNKVFEKASSMLKNGGFIIGRNFNHPDFGYKIKKAISNFFFYEYRNGSFVVGKFNND